MNAINAQEREREGQLTKGPQSAYLRQRPHFQEPRRLEGILDIVKGAMAALGLMCSYGEKSLDLTNSGCIRTGGCVERFRSAAV